MKPEKIKQDLKFSDLGFAGKEETPKQKADRIGVPLIPRRPPATIPHPNPIIAICECGHEIRSKEHRSCPQSNCPLGSTVVLN
jgi:hypothetical protein